jgi:nucleotide-binding universal stress UspA family protein
MSSIPSVLCAVDLSHRSAKVLQHAGAVAEHFRARFVAATVDASESSAAESLAQLARGVLPTSRDWTPEYRIRVVPGRPAATILRIAEEEDADLLVIGTLGAGFSRETGFGSTTLEVLRHAELPVLVVPNGVADLRSFDDPFELTRIGPVLAPIDFSPLSRRDARIAAGIAETLDVPLLLLHVSPIDATDCGLAPDVALTQLFELRKEITCGTPIETLAIRGEPAEAITAVAVERSVGLVVMGLRGAGGVEGPRPGSNAYRTLCATPAMLLALPPIMRRATAATTVGDRLQPAAYRSRSF